MQHTKLQREQYNKYRSRICLELGIKEHQYNWFRRKAQKLHGLYEDFCNGLYNYDEDYDTLIIPLEGIIIKKAKSLGLEAYLQTDPRGGTIYLGKEDMDQSNYNSKGYLIY